MKLRIPKWLKDTSTKLGEIVMHTTILAAVLLSIWVIHHLVEKMGGQDLKVFDFISIKFIADAAHVATIGNYFRLLRRTIWGTDENNSDENN